MLSSMKRRWSAFLALACIAGAVFAMPAAAVWQGKNMLRDGTWKTISGTYFNTPETVQYQQTAGPCSNMRVSIWYANGAGLLAQSPTPVNMCPLGTVKTWSGCNPCPDHPQGVVIKLVGGPADGQTIAGWVNGIG